MNCEQCNHPIEIEEGVSPEYFPCEHCYLKQRVAELGAQLLRIKAFVNEL